MNKIVEQVVEKIVAENLAVDTILLFGSALDDNWMSESDIDLFFIDDKLADGRKDLTIDGVAVEILEDNFEGLRVAIEAERGRLLNRNNATMVATGVIVRSNSAKRIGGLQNLAREILRSPSNYDDEDVKMWKYSISDYLGKASKDVRRNDAVAFYLDAHYALQNALELTLATNGLYLPQPKRLREVLEKVSPELVKILQDYAAASGIEAQMAVLEKLQGVV